MAHNKVPAAGQVISYQSKNVMDFMNGLYVILLVRPQDKLIEVTRLYFTKQEWLGTSIYDISLDKRSTDRMAINDPAIVETPLFYNL